MAPPNPFWVQRYLRDHNLDALLAEAVNQVRGSALGMRAPAASRLLASGSNPLRACLRGLTLACGAGGGAEIDRPRRLAGAVFYHVVEAQWRGDQDQRPPHVQQVCTRVVASNLEGETRPA